MPEPFEIYLSRRATLFFMLCASVIFWAGLEMVWLHNIFGPEDLTANPVFVYILAGIFFGIVPIIIVLRLIPYLVKPPRMLRVDSAHVTFGTWFNYKPTQIPTKHLVGVRGALPTPDGSTLRPEQFALLSGLTLDFEKHPDVPPGEITSAGIRFGNYKLLISRLYGNKSVKESIKAIKPFIRK